MGVITFVWWLREMQSVSSWLGGDKNSYCCEVLLVKKFAIYRKIGKDRKRKKGFYVKLLEWRN